METKEGFGMVTLKLNPGDKWGAGGGEGQEEAESGRKLRVGYSKRKNGSS